VLDCQFSTGKQLSGSIFSFSARLRLEHLVVNCNKFSEITQPDRGQPMRSLCIKHLSLSGNLLWSWSSIDNLQHWCPSLDSLSISDNPLLHGKSPQVTQLYSKTIELPLEPWTRPHIRQIMISRLRSLKSFNSSAVSLHRCKLLVFCVMFPR
jgi:hypothetical protein